MNKCIPLERLEVLEIAKSPQISWSKREITPKSYLSFIS